MPARLRRSGIQRRLDICKAREQNPDLTYREIQAKFDVSSRIIASALKTGRVTWEKMLEPGITSPFLEHDIGERDPPQLPVPFGRATNHSLKYIAVVMEPLAGRGDRAPFRYRIQGQDWQEVDTPGMEGFLGDLAAKGWELVYMSRIGLGRGTSPFDGTYECILKSRG